MERLHKYIASCGITSRRKAEELILQKRVLVNNKIVSKLGTKIDPRNVVVSVDGTYISKDTIEKKYIILNKPRGYITTLSDPHGRKTVLDLIGKTTERIFPVGRLDYLSEGLLIMTNDGNMAQKIIHPSKEIIKVYEVKVFGNVTVKILRALKNGTYYKGKILKPKSVRIIKQLKQKTWLEFRLYDGKNREIRRICENNGITIDKLKRISIGGLNISGIAPGKYVYTTKKHLIRMLSQKEILSNKKTIYINESKVENKKPANDKSYYKFNKKFYFNTIKRTQNNI